jgi:hypothetical protein
MPRSKHRRKPGGKAAAHPGRGNTRELPLSPEDVLWRRFVDGMRATCDRCGQQRMFSETYSAQRDMLIRDIIARMRHDGCGGRAGRVELLTGIEGASSRPVRRIALIDG